MRTRSQDGRSLSASDGRASPTSPYPSGTVSNNRHGESLKIKRKDTKIHTTIDDSAIVSARSSIDIAPPIPERSPRRISSSSNNSRSSSPAANLGNHRIASATASSTSNANLKETHLEHPDSDQLHSATAPSNSRPVNERPTLAGLHKHTMAPPFRGRNRLRSPWACSFLTLLTTLLAAISGFVILYSFMTRQLDPKGCSMSFMRPAFAKFSDFDTEHTRFASKYSLYLYREGGVDEDTRVKGTPVLFIPGNAGSYKQVRPLAAEAAVYFQQHLQNDPVAINLGKRPLDFFSVDFNEDITAFHGQTMLDQAEYLNEAVAYILSLYHNPNRSLRDADLPDPTSVIIVGHSMGGVVARTMLTLPNYQTNSINTIITLAAPHARAPVSFDSEIVKTYRRINDYWRNSYSQKWANDNPLWHVTLISIAGGGLDSVVPSDYSTIASLVPPSHGFTVFTSTIPRVWTGMDHLSITWCDEFRKILVRALFDIVDAGRSSQTLPRIDRMRTFKRWLLTGLEDIAERSIAISEPQTLLTLEHDSNSIISQGERLTLRELGVTGRRRAYLLPIPPQDSVEPKKFSLLTNQKIGRPGGDEMLEVMFCSIYPPNDGQSSTVFSTSIDLSKDGTGSTKLACKNAANDVVTLPASTSDSRFPFDKTQPFSYIQYDLEHLADQQFVAVVDKSTQLTAGWLVAEFFSEADTQAWTTWDLTISPTNSSLTMNFGPIASTRRPMLTEIKAPSIYSALLAYQLRIDAKHNGDKPALFAPFVRQSIAEPYESKFFVNVKEADISMHGVAPYVPPPLKVNSEQSGLLLQIWSDPTSTSEIQFTLKLDIMGSMGKLWMRYRTVLVALPVMVVALVLRKQFMHYDESGVFMSFAEGLDQSLRRSIPLLILVLTVVGVSTGSSAAASGSSSSWFFFWRSKNTTEALIDFAQNDLLMGSPDPIFWFLLPLFGVISVGVCIALNYLVLALSHVLALVYGRTRKHLHGRTERRRSNSVAVTPFRRRLAITIILLLLVSTVIPYQFVYVVLCIVQLSTCVRLLSFARDTYATTSLDFYNYAHSIFVLMAWMLPINLPILVVWSRNLAVHWLTPFSSHHNILSITPFVLLVETLGTGKMIPRSHSWIPRQLTNWLFMLLACYATIYGVTYAYLLHRLVNVACAWLVLVHINGLGVNWRQSLSVFFENISSVSSGSPCPRPSSSGYFLGGSASSGSASSHVPPTSGSASGLTSHAHHLLVSGGVLGGDAGYDRKKTP